MKKRDEIPRRDFLAGSLCSAGLLMPGVLSAGAVERVFGGRKAVRIGYWDGSESLESFESLTHIAAGSLDDVRTTEQPADESTEPSRHRILDATTLPRGDRRFATRGARILIHGLFEANRVRFDDLASLGIYVHPRPFASVPFLAWGLDSRLARHVSGPIRFDVPIERASGLTISFDVGGSEERASPELTPVDPGFGEDHIFARFALDSTRGTPKLRRGVYLVAWSAGGARTMPSWSRYGVEVPQRAAEKLEGDTSDAAASPPEEARTTPSRLVCRRGGLEKFAYVVLSVDYAENPETTPESED